MTISKRRVDLTDSSNKFPSTLATSSQAAWMGRNPGRLVPANRTTFFDKADTTTIPDYDTGQPIVMSVTGNMTARISSGKYTFTPGAGTSAAATYRMYTAPSPVTRTGCRFIFDDIGGTRAGSASLCLGMTNMPVDVTNTAFRINSHFTLYKSGWNCDVVTSASGTAVFTSIASGTFATPLVEDGTTIYTVEVYRVGDTLTFFLPDGTVATATNAHVADYAGNSGFIEHYVNNVTNDGIVSFVEDWFDTGTQNPENAVEAGTSAAGVAAAIIAERTATATLQYKTLDASNILVPYDNGFALTSFVGGSRANLFDTNSGQANGTTLHHTLPAAKSTLATTEHELHHDFTDDANGTPVTADSGQPWTLTRGPSKVAAVPVISSGKFVIADATAGAAAGYLTARMSGSVTYLEGDFAFATSGGSTDGAAAGLLTFVSNLGSPILGTVPDSPCHLACTRTGYYYSVIVGGSFISVTTVTYAAAVDSQHVEVYLDKANSVAYVRGADGSITQISHSAIGTLSPTYATAEVYYNAADTDKRLSFTSFAATPTRTRGLKTFYDLLRGERIAAATLQKKTINQSSLDINDNLLFVRDHTDPSKGVFIDTSNVTTGTVRTLKMPDRNDTLVTLNGVENLTNKYLNINNIVAPADSGFAVAAAADTTKNAFFDVNTSQTTGTSTHHVLPAVSSTLAYKDASGNVSADNFVSGFTTRAGSGTPVTLTVNDTRIQEVTGSTNQTFVLPTTGVPAGFEFQFRNKTTGNAITVQSSGLNTITAIGVSYVYTFIARIANPTAAADWDFWFTAPYGLATAAGANTAAQRDGNANLLADAFIPGFTTTATAGATTTLTVDSTETQEFTGSANQTCQLPTTSIVAGQRYTIINDSSGVLTINASGGTTVATVALASIVVQALVATPTLATQWLVVAYGTHNSNVVPVTSGSGLPTNLNYSTTGTTNSIAQRNGSANLLADAFIPGFTTTATAAATTTLTVDSTEVQEFTGTTTQIVALPTTGVVAGHRVTIVNNSTGVVTVNASGGGTLQAINNGFTMVVTALVATPTTAAQWSNQITSNLTVATSPLASTIARRDGNANLNADAFIPGFTTTVTSAAGSTVLTVDSTEVQEFTGTASGHTVTLPTTSIVAGQKFTLTNNGTQSIVINASAGGFIGGYATSNTVTLTALVATPTLPAHWAASAGSSFGYRSIAQTSSVAVRDGNANLFTDNFIAGQTLVTTAAGTTTLTVDSTFMQLFTGTSTQTVVLPTTNVVAGQGVLIGNVSTGNVALQASDLTGMGTIQPGQYIWLIANQATPTNGGHWTLIQMSNLPARAAAQTSSVAARDAQANLTADAFIPGFTTQATAAGTTTLTVDSTEVQEFTGTLAQTVVLPSTGIVVGQKFTLINNTSANLTVQDSALSNLGLVFGKSGSLVFPTTFTCRVAGTTAQWTASTGLGIGTSVNTAAAATSIAQRDAQSNLIADNFIATRVSTVTSAGTLTMTIDSAQVQVFTGSSAHTVVLPTTSVIAGQTYMIVNNSSNVLTVQSSNATFFHAMLGSRSMVVQALIDTPVAPADWAIMGAISRTAATANTLALRTTEGNLLADAFIPGFTTTVTAAGTTTLTNDSSEVQEFTGTLTQTVVLPTTSVSAGQRYTIVNSASANLTVQASAGGTITTNLSNANFSGTFTALVATPTLPAHWAFVINTNYRVTTSAAGGTVATRDAQANLAADAFIPGFTTTVTAAGTTTLTVDSTEMQEFTGSSNQTVVLPTTGIVAGQRFTIVSSTSGQLTIQSSGLNIVSNGVSNGRTLTVTALVATPTTAAHWFYGYQLTQSDSTASSAVTIPRRDAQANLLADAFIPGFTTTATAAGTTTLTVDSVEVQEFTGSTTQTVTLPTTSVVAGQRYTIVNNSTGVVTIQASAGGQIVQFGQSITATFTAVTATPTLPGHWTYATAGTAITISAAAAAIAKRDAQANLNADAFIPGATSTATAASTTTLTVDSTEVQIFTGSTTQTCVLPTTSIVAGQRYTITNQSTGAVTVQPSGGGTYLAISSGVTLTVTALVATPTTNAGWAGSTAISANFTTGTAGNSVAQRSSAGFLNAVVFVPNLTSTATAAGTTVLTNAASEVQVFTGATTQTITLPTTSIPAAYRLSFINNSSGALTINASDGTLVKTLATLTSSVITCLQATPTTNTHWFAT